MSGPLILSIFPGIDLLGRAFEEVWPECCLVRGPDLLWGGDVRSFHPPAGKFDGVIGGPPCQAFSALNNIQETHRENLVPEFERVVGAADPSWFLMENVRQAPLPMVDGFEVHSVLLNNRWLGEEQNRVRRFSFGSRDGARFHVRLAPLEVVEWKSAVTAAHAGQRKTHFNKATGGKIQRYTVEEALACQGLPADFFRRFLDRGVLTREAQLKVIANGVPLAMGRAVAQAVKKALAQTAADSLSLRPAGKG